MAMIRSTTVLTAALLNGGGPSVTKWLQPNHANVIAAMTASVMDSTEILRSLRNAIADNASSDLGGLTSSARPVWLSPKDVGCSVSVGPGAGFVAHAIHGVICVVFG
jgi:hypothetical protein